MATAYTAGLRVTPWTLIRKERRLPLRGEVLVEIGQAVEPDTILARAFRPGLLTSLNVAERLGIEPEALPSVLQVKEGDEVDEGQLLAEHKALFGLVTTRVIAPHQGKVEFLSTVTGNLGLRQPPEPLTLTAFLAGTVAEIIPEEGAIIEAHGAYVQGILGIGGESVGELYTAVESNDKLLAALDFDPKGKVVIAGAGVSDEVLEALKAQPAAALVVGSLLDHQLSLLLGYEIGVAITGNEPLEMTVVITEGFGEVAMAHRTFEILASLEGKRASVSGATQIRAGVMRPELFVPHDQAAISEAADQAEGLAIGARIRLIRAPYFGKLGRVTALPEQLQEIETGAKVRVLEALLDEGSKVVVPRANVELYED